MNKTDFAIKSNCNVTGASILWLTSYGQVRCYSCALKLVDCEYEHIVKQFVNYDDNNLYCDNCSKHLLPELESDDIATF